MEVVQNAFLQHHKLCGFAHVVVTLGANSYGFSDGVLHPGPQVGIPVSHGDASPSYGNLVGATCTLLGQGSDVYVRVDDTGLLLFPVSSDNAQAIEDDSSCKNDMVVGSSPKGGCVSPFSTASSVSMGSPCIIQLAYGDSPADVKTPSSSKDYCVDASGGGSGNSGKRKRSAGLNGSGGSLLNQLQWLSTRNQARVQGHILAFSHQNGGTRVAALLDVFLPSSVWRGPGFWKSGPAAAAALAHLSCDWDSRRETLQGLETGGQILKAESLWEIGECHVLDCKLHSGSPDLAKPDRFDLHSLFKSLPSYKVEEKWGGVKIEPSNISYGLRSGIWDVPDEVVMTILSRLLPKDLHNVAAVCRYTRIMAVSIMPCMNLNLFPHQQAAVRWMLHREQTQGVLPNPLHRKLETEDGFPFFLDVVSGDLSPEMPLPVHDFRGGLFCDEPGLGKTVTALSLILKTQGAVSEPPTGSQVCWCEHSSGEKVGYYEVSAKLSPMKGSVLKRSMTLKARKTRAGAWESCRGALQYQLDYRDTISSEAAGNLFASTFFPTLPDLPSSGTHKRRRVSSATPLEDFSSPFRSTRSSTVVGQIPLAAGANCRVTRSSARVKCKLSEEAEKDVGEERTVSSHGNGRASSSLLEDTKNRGTRLASKTNTYTCGTAGGASSHGDCSPVIRKAGKTEDEDSALVDADEVWVQCDACTKWRKLPNGAQALEEGIAWFCSMNKDLLYQSCSVPEQVFDSSASVRRLPGFYKNGTASGQQQNVAFFASVIKEHAHLLDGGAKRPLLWLANLNHDKLAKLAGVGLTVPREVRGVGSGDEQGSYEIIYQAFGLVQSREGKGDAKWQYPKGLDELVFDLSALSQALLKPMDDATRLYLSKATLIVVPQNLVEHWKNQITKHTTPGQLCVYVWTDHKKPPVAHTLAWDYDIVITTFHRLSSEWSSRENTVLMRVHWLRVILDEGHTLGASLSLTNKLQMAISMHASRRWLLTGTPTPNTPNSQVAHLQPMLKFLHEGIYGKQQKLWENAILRPFEAGREEGRARLLMLLHRVMISSRKADLCTIPPCVRKVKLLDFTEKHAASYNELVVTVQRNILMADWKDPSHVESLLNPKQWKFRGTTLRNVRLSCCVAGHIKVRNAGEDIRETMDIFVKEQGLDRLSEEFSAIESALLYGGNCDRCQEWCRLPIVTPCRHLLCMSCVALDREKCTLPDCGNLYKMQSPAQLARPENPHPKWPVPQDLIELQPSYVQDNWDPDWQATSSSKLTYLVEQLRMLECVNTKQQRPLDADVDIEPCTPDMRADEWPIFSNKSQTALLPEKAIVFSQFLEHINVVELQLSTAGIQHVGMYSPMHSANKLKSLLTFQNDPACMVLVMDGSGALGLDLSFVTHVYLMEPIWDRSMEEQVVSRAHRMGATRPVLVETLAMRGTIEEQMLDFLQIRMVSATRVYETRQLGM